MKNLSFTIGVLLAGAGLPAIAQAQDASQRSSSGESAGLGDNVIVVTARKKAETDLDVPIAIKALGRTQLERFGVQNLSDVAAITPSLNVSSAAGNSGGTITLRGIGTPTAGPGVDQAVSLNFDGVTVADGTAIRFAQFDLERVEVLQGPQSLFFGKNSSGGVVSVISADPTDEFYAMMRVGYGFQARNLVTEAVLSGPLADGLSGRIAFYRSDMAGYFRNPLATTTAVPTADQVAIFGPLPRPSSDRAPKSLDTGGRATLLFEPTDALTVNLKGTYLKQKGASSYAAEQNFFCPAGEPDPNLPANIVGVAECELNHIAGPIGLTSTAEQGGNPLFRDGHPYQELEQYLLVGKIDYDVSEGLSLASTTGYYGMHLLEGSIVTFSPYAGIGATNDVKRTEFTQELRLTTDLDGPLNGMFGGFYQNGNYHSLTSVTVFGGFVPSPDYFLDTRTYSAFGQLSYDLTDQVQISAGGRYTNEKKSFRLFSDELGPNGAFADDLGVSQIVSKKFSPEVTLSWHPQTQTNVFITYKRGTKSGGFNLPAINFAPYTGKDFSYEDENAEGVEGGVKSVLLDGDLRFDLTGYRYKYKNLQVTVFDPVVAVTGIRNAAVAKIWGVQMSTNYAPRALPGLSLAGSVNYSHARYSDYLADCYAGQTISEGCNRDANGGIVANGGIFQNLVGRPLSNAPDWSGSLTGTYEFAVDSESTRVGVTVGATYTDQYYAINSQPIASLQKSSVNLDAQIRLFDDDRGWEVALIGKNLTDQLRIGWGVEAPFTPFGVDAGTGTNGPRHLADLVGATNPPREIMLRFTIRPAEFFGAR